jgi:elongation factor Ts
LFLKDHLNKEKEIYRQQALNEGKPEKIIDKIVEGKINKYYKEVCLIEQPWIKDQDKSVKKFMAEKSKEANGELKVARFSRFEKGEGIEKKKEDFAAEVRSQMK